MLTDQKRAEMRLKQEFLLMLAVDMSSIDESLRIDEKNSAPRLSDLRQFIYPEWEFAIDSHLSRLATDQQVSVPNFSELVAKNIIIRY